MSDDEGHEHEFEQQDNAGTTQSAPASALRQGGYVMIDGNPCGIASLRGRGTDTVHITGVDIFTGRQYKSDVSTGDNVDVPVVRKTQYQLVNIDDGKLNLMDSDGNTKDDVDVPEHDLGDAITAEFDDGKDLLVTIINAMGQEAAISYNEAPKGS